MNADRHALHLDFAAFDGDRAEGIARAGQAGVGIILNPSIDAANAARVVELVEQQETLYAAIGVHPNSSTGWDAGSELELKKLAANKKVVAIGEIGLDYYRDAAPKEVQHSVFERQLELAAEMELPVIIHNREASDDVLGMLLDWQAGLMRAASSLAERPGVLHSFSADVATAEKAIAAHFFIGFTGPVTFKNAPELQAIAAALPLENMLVETDGPFLSPHPLRGQRNEPARVKLVAGKIAELKGLSFDEVAAVTTANAQRLFRFGERQ
jgi:TatD DNase family protein